MSVASRLNSQAHYSEKQYADGSFVGKLVAVSIKNIYQRVVGFLDDTLLSTCRPGDSHRRTTGTVADIQRSFYTGWVKKHGLKAQTVLFPDGMFGHVFIASMRNNDNGVLNMSRLADYMSENFPDMEHNPPNLHQKHALYCDAVFQNHACLINRSPGPETPHSKALYRRYNGMRTSIEHSYAHFKNLFKIFQNGRRLRLMDDAGAIQRLIVVCFLIFNCRTCMDGGNCTVIFTCPPPTLEEYLPLDEVLDLAPIVTY